MLAARTVQPGDVVAGRFRVEREAGRGGMGTVYRAIDLEGGAPIALKLVHPGTGADSERFARESDVLASLGHPGIVRHVAHGLDGVRPWLAMEWLEGESLADALRRGPLPEPEAIAMVRAAAEALGAAHLRGIVHRDVKPGNLFLVGGSPRDVRVLDFGIARTIGQSAHTLTTTGTVLGTAAYMAPEQARAGRDLDARADVWALGCVLYQASSGQKPFDHESLVGVLAAVLLEEPRPLSEVAPHASAALEALVRELLDKDREKRPADGAELARRLDAIGSDAGPRAAASSARGITARERRVVCVVLARPKERAAPDATGPGAGWDLEVTGSRADTEGTLRAIADAHHGQVELLADGTLVVALDDTGTPGDQAERAARLALAMREQAHDVDLVLAAGRAELHGRVPVGDVVDRGARLLARADAEGAVAIDELVAELLGDRFELEVAGGKVALRAARPRAGAPQPGIGGLPFVGRDRELSMLVSVAEESREERVARVALVTGPPGSGKTRLALELERSLARSAPETRFFSARGEPLALGAPFSIAARLVRGAAGIAEGEALASRRDKLVRLAERAGLGTRALHTAALLGEIARAPFDDTGDEALRAARRDSLVLGDLLRRAFAEWLGAEAARAPLVVVLDDLHAIDGATLSLLDAALRESATRQLLVVGFGRPGPAGPPRAAPFSDREPQQLVLRKLVSRHCRALAEAALGTAATPARLDALAERCEGNPFFLEAMARAMVRGGGEAAPVSVLGIVEDRLGELTPRARRVLRAASVLGAGARRADVSALVPDLSAAEVEADLGVLETEGLLGAEGGPDAERRWSFRQPLVREAAYAMLTDDDRRLAHRLASEVALREPEHDPAVLAEHLDRAGLGGAAATALARAADRALAGHDLGGAIALAERGLTLADGPVARGALLAVHARAARWQGRYETAFRSASEALAIVPPGEAAWLDAAATLLSAAAARGRGDDARALRGALLDLAPSEARTAALVVVLARAGALLLAAGEDAERDALSARARALRATLPGPEPLADAWLSVLDASVALRDGDVGAFALGTEAAAVAYERAGDVRDAVNQRVRLGNAWVSLGAPERAEPVLRAAAREAGRMGLPLVEGYAWQNLGHALARQGRGPEARASLEHALALAASLGDGRLEAGSRLYLADVARAEGRPELAVREAERALSLLEGAGAFRLVALATLARASLEAGDARRAVALAGEALALRRGADAALEEGDALVVDALAQVLAATGRDAEAHALCHDATARLHERAERIADPGLRASFLERVPEHTRLRARAAMPHG